MLYQIGLPLFIWCEIQGLFHDFPGPFQGNPAPSLSTKTWTLYRFFSKQTLLFGFTELAVPENEKQPMTQFTSTKSRPCKVAVFVLRHCRDKNTITNSTFLLFLEVKEKICCLFQDFQAPRPKFKDFPGHGNFFPPIPGLCRIFKDRGNPDQISPSSHYSSNSLQ